MNAIVAFTAIWLPDRVATRFITYEEVKEIGTFANAVIEIEKGSSIIGYQNIALDMY